MKEFYETFEELKRDAIAEDVVAFRRFDDESKLGFTYGMFFRDNGESLLVSLPDAGIGFDTQYGWENINYMANTIEQEYNQCVAVEDEWEWLSKEELEVKQKQPTVENKFELLEL